MHVLKSLVRGVVAKLGYRTSLNIPEPLIDARVRQLPKDMWPVIVDRPLFRAGGAGDGAYLIPDDLDGIAALFSPGVDQVAQFEVDMAARGMTCYLADASVEQPPVEDPRFLFERKFLGIAGGESFMTLDDWVNRLEPGDHDLMLQMDIEGAEWLVLANASDALLSRFRIMVIEFHSLGRMFDEFGAQVMPEVFQRLLRTHHVVHNHPNNVSYVTTRGGVDIPELIEVTFLRKDRAAPTGYAGTFPHPLDIVNVPERPLLPLPASWHG